MNINFYITAYVSGQSGGSDIITEETNNENPTKTEGEVDGSNNAIVIQVSDADSEASKGKHIFILPLLIVFNFTAVLWCIPQCI